MCGRTAVLQCGHTTTIRRPYGGADAAKRIGSAVSADIFGTTCTSETSADDNPPVVDSRSTVGSIVGERSDDDSGNLELVRGGPTGPDMTLKASGGDTGNHASPQRALQDPSTSSSLFCPTLRIPNVLINKREVTRSQVGRCSSIAMASSHWAPSHHGPLSVLCQFRRTLPRTSL